MLNRSVSQDFKRHPNYPLGVQRRPAMPVGAPAITWHLAFWIPDGLAGVPDNASMDDPHGRWISNIGKFAVALHCFLEAERTDSRDIDYSPSTLPIVVDKHTTCISFLWETMPVKIRIEPHREYFTLTSAIDLSLWDNWRPAGEVLGPNAVALRDAISTLNDFATVRYAQALQTEKHITRSNNDRLILDAPYQIIYHEIWKKFRERILGKVLDAVAPNDIGAYFADFRVLAISCGLDNQFIKLPVETFHSASPLTKPSLHQLEYLAAVEAIRPFIDLSDTEHEELEYTFSRILNGRGLHASALGTRSGPLTEVFYFTHGSRWQVGRHIDRSNALGTLRLAALYDIDRLDIANDELRGLMINLEAVSRQLPDITPTITSERLNKELLEVSRKLKNISRRRPPLSALNDTNRVDAASNELKALAGRLDMVSRQLPAINRNISTEQLSRELLDVLMKLAYIGQKVTGGLRRRVERSRYYRQRFNDLVPILRIQRIEGFQPYDEFIKRRLGGSYDFINIVGQRYDQVQKTIGTLNRQVRAVELYELQKKVTRQTETVAKLQNLAERAFWAIPFPYYASTLAVDIAADLARRPNMAWLANWDIAIRVSLLFVGLCVALKKKREWDRGA